MKFKKRFILARGKCQIGINLTKTEELYIQNIKTSLREIKGLNKWRNLICSTIHREYTLGHNILSKARESEWIKWLCTG